MTVGKGGRGGDGKNAQVRVAAMIFEDFIFGSFGSSAGLTMPDSMSEG
ncbi:MAG: hypothetical protein HT580_07695 [Dechloromonas sp.]|nr:MAG: hypothetical protein HT580_07695 [Dechloromonas sp.]